MIQRALLACLCFILLSWGQGSDAVGQVAARDKNLTNVPTVNKVVSEGWKGSFSPDGSKLVYGKRDRSGLMIRDLESGQITEFTKPGETGRDAAWSPDGTWIAYVKVPAGAYYSEEVWLISPDGLSERKLAEGEFPQWSSDGERVFYHSRHDNAIDSISVLEQSEEPSLFYGKPLSWYPAISPDERLIAFGNRGMLTIVEQETGRVFLTMPVPGARGLLPAWSPDGPLLAYGGFNADRAGVWVPDLKAERARRFIKGAYTMPVWSPDGSKLLFDYGGDGWEIWSIDVNTIW